MKSHWTGVKGDVDCTELVNLGLFRCQDERSLSPLGPRPLDEAGVHAEHGVRYDDRRVDLGEDGGVAEPGGAHGVCRGKAAAAAGVVDEERSADGQCAIQLFLGARNVAAVLR